MRAKLLLTLGVLCLTVAVIGCGKSDSVTLADAQGKAIAQKTCPVMRGNAINPKIFVDYEGRRIYFCCTLCPPKFKADPQKYLKIVDEDLKKAAPAAPQEPATVYTCPMHPEVKQDKAGKCPKCGMDLVPEKGAAPTEGHEGHTH